MEIQVRNANEMFEEMFWRFKSSGVKAESRNGPVIRIPEPVLTRMRHPAERVLFHGGRDANPVFHLMESIWMLAGRRDVAFLQQFNSKIGQYSDDGEVFNAAYGHRWRHHFGRDQLIDVIERLRAEPDTRQAVVQMWDAADLTKPTKDRACNMQLIFEVLDGRLNMTVINRSNDAWWGYAGANVVHFTVLQEVVASALGVRLGEYRTFTTNLHLYTELYSAAHHVQDPPSSEFYDLYSQGQVRPLPIMLNEDYLTFLEDCGRFCADPFNAYASYRHPFFLGTAHPMAMISRARKLNAGTGEGWAEKVKASDWRRAAFDWIHRRETAKQSKAAS
jgi:hypothetical protein